MGKSKNAVAVSESGIPAFSRLNGEPCGSCGLEICLPDHPHGPGLFYHVGLGRFLTFDEIEVHRENGSSQLEPGLPEDFRSLGAYERHLEQKKEDRKRKVRDRVQRHRKRKRLEGGQDVTLGTP